MARTSILPIVARVRTLIGDLGDPATYTDDQIAAVCDLTATRLLQADCEPIPEQTPVGVRFYTWKTPEGWIENPVFQTTDGWDTLEPSAVLDPVGTVVQFTPAPSGRVVVSGVCHDPYAAAADLLDQWAVTMEQTHVSLKVDEFQVSRDQVPAALRARAADYRLRSRNPQLPAATSGHIVRDDIVGWW